MALLLALAGVQASAAQASPRVGVRPSTQAGLPGNLAAPSPAGAFPNVERIPFSSDAAELVTATDVVLSLSVPTQTTVGTPTVTAASSSWRAASVTACPAASTGFSYNFCAESAGSCVEGTYSATGVTVSNPFAANGTGTLSVPTPSVGSWGLRIRYTYTTDGNCAAPQISQWPATGWSPLSVLPATPAIQLRNASDTADIPKLATFVWVMSTGQTARAYALLDGVRDVNPPASLSWSYRRSGSFTETPIGTAQGAAFFIPAAGEYEIVLRGYGDDVIGFISVGGATMTPSIRLRNSTDTADIPKPTGIQWELTPGQVARSYAELNGVRDLASVQSWSYRVAGAGQETTIGSGQGPSFSIPLAGDYEIVLRGYGADVVNPVTVSTSGGGGGGGGASCSFVINDSSGATLPYDSFLNLYGGTSGQALTFVASGTTSTVNWAFGNGASGTGNGYVYTYRLPGATSQRYTVTLSSGTCSASSQIDVVPEAGQTGLDFSVADASTGVLLPRTGTTYEASSGQLLRFIPIAATGAVAWDFGDGTFSVLAAPEKAYTAVVDTTFVAKLTNAANTRTYNVAVKGSTGAPLTGNYSFRYVDGTTVDRAAVEPNKLIRFTGADQATSYTWDFGDGSVLATGSPKDHSYSRGGSFTVKLTVARDGVSGTVTTPSPLAFTVKPPPDPLLWVAAGMAYVDGAGGERWQSDLTILNPGLQTATLSLGFVSGSSWDGATSVSWLQEALVPGATKSYPNVLESLFRLGKGSWGVVLVRGDSVPIAPVIVSRTYNAANSETAGTYGLSVPAVSVAAGVRPDSAAGGNVLAGLRHDPAFRTNLAVANLGDDEAQVEVVFRDASGNVLGVPAKLTVEGRGVKQLNSALPAAPAAGNAPIGGAGFAAPVSHFSGEVILRRGSGVYPYATVIDQGTGDSIVVTPVRRPSATYRLPGIVRTSTWRSDVAMLNPSAVERRVRVAYSYVRGGTTTRITAGATLVFRPWEMKVGVDFVRLWLALSGDDPYDYTASYVDISPASDDVAPAEPMVVNGKTYTASGSGTSGLQVDPYVFEDGIGTQASSKRILLSGLEANARFRTNVALFLTPGAGDAGSAEVDVHVYDSRGRESKSIWVRLDAERPVQQIGSSELFAGLTTSESERASIVVNNPRGTARVGAYATVIDQMSLDATYVAGQPMP